MNMFVPEPFTSYDEYMRSLGNPTPEMLREAAGTKGHGSFGHQEFVDAGPSSTAARKALQTIARTSRLSRFRELAIVCSKKNHTIGEIYKTAAGLVLTGRGPLTSVEASALGGTLDEHYNPEFGTVGATEWDYTWEQQQRISREEPVVCLVDQLVDHVATLQCRCTTAVVRPHDVGRWLASGRRRVVYSVGA